MDEVIQKLLAEKGWYPGKFGYDEEKEKITEGLLRKVAEVLPEAMIEEDKKDKLIEAMSEEPMDEKKVEQIIAHSEIRTDIMRKVIDDYRKEYLEEQ